MIKLLELRDFKIDDYTFIFPEIKDARELMQWAGPKYEYPLTWVQMNNKIEEKDEEGLKRNYLFTAFDRLSQSVIGHGQLTFVDKIDKIANIGSVLVFSKYRGHGYGKTLMKSLIRYGFKEMGMNELRLGVFDFNYAAIRCYKQVGFKETSFEENARDVNGEKWNLIRMRILINEFEDEKEIGRPWPEESQTTAYNSPSQ